MTPDRSHFAVAFRSCRISVAAAATLIVASPALAGGEPDPLAQGTVAMATNSVQAGTPATPASPAAAATHEEEIVAWRAQRLERLTAPAGWLSLIGLYWLEEGDNTFGGAEGNSIRLPAASAPAQIGTLVRRGDQLRFTAASGIAVTRASSPGESLSGVEMIPDTRGEPTVLSHGSISFLVIERGGRLALRVRDSENPVRKSFRGLDSYPIDPQWRVEATFEAYDPPRQIPIPNVLGTVENSPSPGAAIFSVGGEILRLDAISEEGSDELFFVFGDRTNGRETYGGGRFLYAPLPGPDGRLILDFNRAYNPPCAFTAFATCPLPPRQNKLAVRIEAGEKKYGEERH